VREARLRADGFSLMLIVGEIRERRAGGFFALPGEKSSGLIGLNEARVPPREASRLIVARSECFPFFFSREPNEIFSDLESRLGSASEERSS